MKKKNQKKHKVTIVEYESDGTKKEKYITVAEYKKRMNRFCRKTVNLSLNEVIRKVQLGCYNGTILQAEIRMFLVLMGEG